MTPEDIARLPYRPCVGVMLANAEGKVFVGQRNDRYREAWQMPQGGIDPGESPREAALRELTEETGIDASRVRIEAVTSAPIPYDLPHEIVPKIWKGKYRGQEQTWVLMRFLGTNSDVNIETDEPEFSTWRWADAGSLVENVVPFKRAVYAAVVAEFEDKL